MLSRENNIYCYSTEAISEMQAIAEAEAKILDNGWSQYDYVFDEIVKL